MENIITKENRGYVQILLPGVASAYFFAAKDKPLTDEQADKIVQNSITIANAAIRASKEITE